MSHKFRHYSGSFYQDICGRCGMTGMEIVQHGNKYCWHRTRLRGGERDYRDEMRRRLTRRAYMRWLGKRKAYLRTPMQRLVRARIENVHLPMDFLNKLLYGDGSMLGGLVE